MHHLYIVFYSYTPILSLIFSNLLFRSWLLAQSLSRLCACVTVCLCSYRKICLLTSMVFENQMLSLSFSLNCVRVFIWIRTCQCKMWLLAKWLIVCKSNTSIIIRYNWISIWRKLHFITCDMRKFDLWIHSSIHIRFFKKISNFERKSYFLYFNYSLLK